ncbi:MAG: nickel pincer cofactor biosynthesis protein LarB [Bacillota bacterium]|nr:nickel pincer cofactor biosynthesis protein LarB [Bacillota bacterium]
MDIKEMEDFLLQVKNGDISIDQALSTLKQEPFADLGFAKLDTHRGLRQGAGEVIYGQGKTPDQIVRISKELIKTQPGVLITRLDPEKAQEIKKEIDLTYYQMGRVGIFGQMKEVQGPGKIVIATGGTSDMEVAEEAALTAEFLGNQVERLYDVGVAGIHRLLAHMDKISQARVIVAIAGMEGALASVIGGLASCPVIAVPTSVGYGANFSGLAALLSMLNSCASGVSVVNIDNGFGAGYLASMINQIK